MSVQQLSKIEKSVTLAGGAFTQIAAVFASDYFLLTVFPSLVGATLRTIKLANDDKLSVGDLIQLFAVALAIGIWGGPWVADMAPKSETALPIMCYCSAYWFQDFGNLIKGVYKSILSNVVSAIATALTKKGK